MILCVGKFNTSGQSLDTFRNDGFCNRIPDTLAHKDGRKSDGLLKKLVNMGSHSSFSCAVQLHYLLSQIVSMLVCLYAINFVLYK